ncbi:MAG: hypothetical protein H0W73_18495 [Bacteroidetes bacterium]|nr:hypothetical protein [Bacteroidota bacterium]
MKTILVISIFFLCACSHTEVDRSKTLKSWEVNIHTGDTINRMDGNNKKQGLWIENKTDTIIYKNGIKAN